MTLRPEEVGRHSVSIELGYDSELGTWHLRVPELSITAGGQKDLAEAVRAVAEAIQFALESAERSFIAGAVKRNGPRSGLKKLLD